MQNTRIVAKNLWRNGTILAYSSQDPQFPAVCSQDDDTTLPWRSRNGVGSGNGLFVVDATNKYIDFNEGGAELTATITPGSYNGTTLAAEIKIQLDAIGGTYTVVYSETLGTFTIARAAGNFAFLWLSGTNTANNAAGLIGFSKAADDTGAATYTSDYARFNTSEYVDLDILSATAWDFISLRNHNLQNTAVITLYGADDSAFTTNLTTDVLTFNADNLTAFLGTARTKRYARLKIVDPSNPSGYISIGSIVLGKYRHLPAQFIAGYGRGYANDSEADQTPSLNRFLTVARPSVERWSLTWNHLSDTARGYIAEAIQECGSVYGVAWCFDYTAPNEYTAWAVMLSPALPVNVSAALWTWTVDIEEHV
jgi:hypothetical protein